MLMQVGVGDRTTVRPDMPVAVQKLRAAEQVKILQKQMCVPVADYLALRKNDGAAGHRLGHLEVMGSHDDRLSIQRWGT